MPITSLLNPDGRINRAAVLLDAQRQFRVMARHGWEWAECLRYSWLRARAMQQAASNSLIGSIQARVQDNDVEPDAGCDS